MNTEKKRLVVLGGAGAMGKITVTDLARTAKEDEEIVIADLDEKKAQDLADTLLKILPQKNIRAIGIDIFKQQDALQKLKGAFCIINAVQYQMNVKIMELALDLRCHYVDLGGLFHVTREQMKLDDRFRRIGKLAILGMGAAPGITNLLSQLCANELDQVQEIHTRVASHDVTKYSPNPALAVSYSLKTILEEFSFEPAVFTKGKFTFVKPMSGDTPHIFPKPIGKRRPMYTIHSEVATLPLSYADKGVQEVSFKIAFDPTFVDRVRFLRDLGMASHDKIKIGDAEVAPIDVVNKVAFMQPVAKQVGKLKQYEVVRAIVKGKKKGKKITLVADCHTAGMPEWGIGLDIDTGTPPAVAAQMLARGEIHETGALPPEKCISSKTFFNHLKKRKMKVVLSKKSGWGFKT